MSQLESKRKQPDIRFRGGDGDWEETCLKHVVDVFDGTHQTPRYTDKGIKFLSVENIKDLESNKFISVDDFNRDFKNYPEYGDVLMTRIGDIGTSNVFRLNYPVAYYVTLALLKPFAIKSDFLNYAIASDFVQADIWRRTLHIAFPKKINMNEIKKVGILLPQSETEQTTIGNFFKQLDDTLALHKRKHQQTQQLKKAMLTKLFPQKGQTQPEIRLQGFRGDWGEKRLGDIGDIITGSTPPTDNIENYSFDGMIWVTPTDIKTNRIETSAKKLSKTGQEIARIVPKNSILVTSIASIGKNTILLKKGSFNQQINALVPFDGFNPYFLLTQSFFWSESMKRVAGHGTMQIVNKNTLADIKTIIPKSLEEQTAIGNFFKQLDDTLALQTQQINTLENLKKAFLQKMFV